MIFQFDLGNSAVKWRVISDGCAVAAGFYHHNEAFPGEILALTKGSCEFQVASVAEAQTTQRLVDKLKRLERGEVIVAESQRRQLGLTSSYRRPHTMGVDRWMAMLGAWHACRKPLVVVDAGSAITVDIVGPGGKHEGGFILPGRRLMLASLQQGTSRVRFQTAEDPVALPGKDTQSCVSRGIYWLRQGLVRQIQQAATVREISEIWVTGGDARLFLDAGLEGRYVQDLVLDGLALYCKALREPGSI